MMAAAAEEISANATEAIKLAFVAEAFLAR